MTKQGSYGKLKVPMKTLLSPSREAEKGAEDVLYDQKDNLTYNQYGKVFLCVVVPFPTQSGSCPICNRESVPQ